MKRIATAMSILLLMLIVMTFIAPLALADDSTSCILWYAQTASNPPEEADVISCEDKLCRDEIGPLVRYESAVANSFLTCV